MFGDNFELFILNLT